jgi:hypothetical protein
MYLVLRLPMGAAWTQKAPAAAATGAFTSQVGLGRFERPTSRLSGGSRLQLEEASCRR